MEGLDIADVLNNAGYETVEGMEAVFRMMEEMAGDGREYGKRQPGETCAYERPLVSEILK